MFSSNLKCKNKTLKYTVSVKSVYHECYMSGVFCIITNVYLKRR